MSHAHVDMTLPNLFIIGAAKSGTTSLHAYLSDHPEISMAEPKEPQIFSAAQWEDELGTYVEMLSADAPIRGESSTAYTFYPFIQGIPERIAASCPDARFIYMVRDPVQRMIAHYVQGFAQMTEGRTIATVLREFDQPANQFVAASRYASQLEQWLRHFDRERFLILEQDDLRERRQATMDRVFEFLGVEAIRITHADYELNATADKSRMTPAAARFWFAFAPLTRRLPSRANKALESLMPAESVGRPLLDEGLRTALEDHLRGEAERFRQMTGMAFESWSV